MAAIWNLPVLFICENNQYATEVPFSYSSGNPSVAGRAANYGMAGAEVDGNDVLAIFETAREAVERARSGFGPTLIECKTYRTRPHAEGMGDFGYRTRDEVDGWKARCPIAQFRSTTLERIACHCAPNWTPSTRKWPTSFARRSLLPTRAPGRTASSAVKPRLLVRTPPVRARRGRLATGVPEPTTSEKPAAKRLGCRPRSKP